MNRHFRKEKSLKGNKHRETLTYINKQRNANKNNEIFAFMNLDLKTLGKQSLTRVTEKWNIFLWWVHVDAQMYETKTLGKVRWGNQKAAS